MWWVGVVLAKSPLAGCVPNAALDEAFAADGHAAGPERWAAWTCQRDRVFVAALEGGLPSGPGESAAKRLGRRAGEVLHGYRCPRSREECPELQDDPTIRVEPVVIDADPDHLVAGIHFWGTDGVAEGWITARLLPNDQAGGDQGRWVICVGPAEGPCQERATRVVADPSLFKSRRVPK